MEILFHCPPAEKIALRSLEEKCNIAAAVGRALVFQPCTKLEGRTPQGQQALMGVSGGDVGKPDCEWAEHGEANT